MQSREGERREVLMQNGDGQKKFIMKERRKGGCRERGKSDKGKKKRGEKGELSGCRGEREKSKIKSTRTPAGLHLSTAMSQLPDLSSRSLSHELMNTQTNKNNSTLCIFYYLNFTLTCLPVNYLIVCLPIFLLTY